MQIYYIGSTCSAAKTHTTRGRHQLTVTALSQRFQTSKNELSNDLCSVVNLNYDYHYSGHNCA